MAQTELLATVPFRYAAALASSEAIRLLPVPVELPSFEVKQYWHERYHADVLNRWLRQVLGTRFVGGGEATGRTAEPDAR